MARTPPFFLSLPSTRSVQSNSKPAHSAASGTRQFPDSGHFSQKMMANEACPVCGSTVNAKFTAGSNWCIVCSEAVLDEQARDGDTVEPEIIEL